MQFEVKDFERNDGREEANEKWFHDTKRLNGRKLNWNKSHVIWRLNINQI